MTEWPKNPKYYRNGDMTNHPEFGDDVLKGTIFGDFTREAIESEESNINHQSMKNRDRNCSVWLPLLFGISIMMLAVTELLAAKWPGGSTSAIDRDAIKQRNDDAEGHGDFQVWAWAHLISLFTHIAGLVVVLFYYLLFKRWYDKARGCAKEADPSVLDPDSQEFKDARAKSMKFADRVKGFCWFGFVAHLAFGLYAALIAVRSFVELGNTGKREYIGEIGKYEAVMIYYLLWGFGSLIAGVAQILACILFNLNARFVYQACGGVASSVRSAWRRMRGKKPKGSAPMVRNVRAPSRSYYDAAKRF